MSSIKKVYRSLPSLSVASLSSFLVSVYTRPVLNLGCTTVKMSPVEISLHPLSLDIKMSLLVRMDAVLSTTVKMSPVEISLHPLSLDIKMSLLVRMDAVLST